MSARTTVQPTSRPTLVYEENWEEHLTAVGPGASHWLFTGNMPVIHDAKQRATNPFTQPSGNMNDYASQRAAHQQPGDVTPDFATSASSVRERCTSAIGPYSEELGDAGPSLCRGASISVDSLETVPSLYLRTSPSQDSLASWTSFDALDPDPFHVSPVEPRIVDDTERFVAVAVPDVHERTVGPVVDTNRFKQLSRHHFALHQHPQLAIHPTRRLTPPPTTVVASSLPRDEAPRLERRMPRSTPHRQCIPGSSVSKPALAAPQFAITSSSPSVALSTAAESMVQRPHVASQPAALATSPAAWSMRSILVSVGDASSSAAVRSLRRMMRLDSEADATTGSRPAASQRPTQSRPSLPDDWVLV